jgi:hypothetical protein
MSTRRLLGLLAIAVLTAACSTTSSARPPATTAATQASPAEQAAALDATTGYRRLMSDAGEQLSTALTAQPPDFSSARAALDQLRSLMATDGRPDPLLATALTLGSNDASLEALAAEAPLVALISSRVTLAPADIALELQHQAEWLSEQAPLAGTGTDSADLVVTAAQMARGTGLLLALGALVDPVAAERARAATSALAIQTGTTDSSVRSLVSAADLASARLGDLAAALEGYGQGGQYQ